METPICYEVRRPKTVLPSVILSWSRRSTYSELILLLTLIIERFSRSVGPAGVVKVQLISFDL